MPMPEIKITTYKDGRQVAWFREPGGRVRTRLGPVDWERADQVRALGEYGIELQLAQAAAGIGSDGTPMPRLKDSGRARFAGRVNGVATFVREGYAQQKQRQGLRPMRDLRGPGKGGHMLDAVRMTYLDDKTFKFGITTRLGRVKARANEQRAAWWGWSPASVGKMAVRAAEIHPQGIAENLVKLGLAGAAAIAGGGRKVLLRRPAA